MQNNKWYKDDTEKYIILKNRIGRTMCIKINDDMRTFISRISFVIDEEGSEFLVISDKRYNKEYIGFYNPKSIKMCIALLYDREFDYYTGFDIDKMNKCIRRARK